jgi:hypothetical protein
MVSRSAVASQNSAAALHSHQEHIAAEMHTSKQQLKFNATTKSSTMQLIILCCLLHNVVLPRKHWQLAENTAAVSLLTAQPAAADAGQLHHKKVGMHFMHNTLIIAAGLQCCQRTAAAK